MAKSSFRWLKWTIFLIVAGALTGWGVWYYMKRSVTAPQYQTAAITRGDLEQVVTATGSLNPVVNIQVGSQISGRIDKINVDFNSEVKSNQVIALIDPSTYELAVLRAQAQVSNAVANLALAKVQAERAKSLFQDNLIPAADYDSATAQLQQADAAVRTAEANLESADVDLSRCTIVSPVDGVVISRNVDVGQTVAASFNTPTLFLIANDLSKMQIGALISEADIGGVAVGQKVNFLVDAYPYRTFHGQVSQIRYGPVTNQNVVNYSAIIEVNNEDLKLLPGMTANVSIIIAERADALRIPNAAFRFRPPETAEPLPGAAGAGGSTGTNGPGPVASAEAGGNAPSGAMGAIPGGGAGRQGMRGGRGMGAGGGRGMGGRGGERGGREGGGPRTVYVLEPAIGKASPVLKPVSIRTGINDGIYTEVLEGLSEGDEVVTGLAMQQDGAQMRQQPQSNPFGGGRRRF